MFKHRGHPIRVIMDTVMECRSRRNNWGPLLGRLAFHLHGFANLVYKSIYVIIIQSQTVDITSPRGGESRRALAYEYLDLSPTWRLHVKNSICSFNDVPVFLLSRWRICKINDFHCVHVTIIDDFIVVRVIYPHMHASVYLHCYVYMIFNPTGQRKKLAFVYQNIKQDT